MHEPWQHKSWQQGLLEGLINELMFSARNEGITIEDLLTAYEETWRDAALRDRRQFRVFPRGPDEVCAWFAIRNPAIKNAAGYHRVSWTCPICRYAACKVLSAVMVHLNDHHAWTWDMFANKFRDVLAEGQEKKGATNG